MNQMKKPLVILDSSEEILNKQSDFKVFNYVVYKRPNLNEFITRLEKHYEIAIWSSAGNDYVNSIIEQLELNVKIKFIWGRNESTQKRQLNDYYETGNNTEYYLERILIIDDSPHKSKLNYGNAICPKPYKGESEDNELLKLIDYLESIKDEPDFRSIEKRNWRKKYDQ